MKTADAIGASGTTAPREDLVKLPKTYEQKDYPHVTVWTPEDWAAHSLNKKGDHGGGIHQRSPHRGKPKASSTEVRESMAYLQDANGNPITQADAYALTEIARGLWQKLKEGGHLTLSEPRWSKASDYCHNYFYANIIQQHDNFRLANNLWKIHKFIQDSYPGWCRYNFPKGANIKSAKVEDDLQGIRMESTPELDIKEYKSSSKKRKVSITENSKPEDSQHPPSLDSTQPPMMLAGSLPPADVQVGVRASMSSKSSKKQRIGPNVSGICTMGTYLMRRQLDPIC